MRMAIGGRMSRLYLFRSPEAYSAECIISSHGGKNDLAEILAGLNDPLVDSAAKFIVPHGVELIFYSDSNESVQDAGIVNFAAISIFNVTENRVFKAGMPCYNYELSKYQNPNNGHWFAASARQRNSKGETYDVIDKFVSTEHEIKRFGRSIENSLLEGFKAARNLLGSSEEKSDNRILYASNFDIVTVRNRWWGSSYSLEDAVRDILAVHRYRKIHCYFCRG